MIVYAPTIARVEETVDSSKSKASRPSAYHGKMEADERRRNQERWMSDEVRVLVGTIAFGLGINKASVRAVIHLSLPKSIEQYYQEAGRAGRDGQPADCILLWQKRDAALLAHFIEQITDPAEKERAWQRYHQIRDFAEIRGAGIGRSACISERRRNGRLAAHVMCAASRPEWMAVPVQEAYRSGRRKLRITRTEEPTLIPRSVPKPDDGLGDYLREWRRSTAKRLGIPAFIVMHDTSLEELCRVRPKSLGELNSITGFGERKIEAYGEQIIEALREFERGARAVIPQERKTSPAEETLRLLNEGKSLGEIAVLRQRQLGTVVNTVAALVEQGEVSFDEKWVDPTRRLVIEAACARVGIQWLKPIKEALPAEISFEDIRLVVARLRWLETTKKQPA